MAFSSQVGSDQAWTQPRPIASAPAVLQEPQRLQLLNDKGGPLASPASPGPADTPPVRRLRRRAGLEDVPGARHHESKGLRPGGEKRRGGDGDRVEPLGRGRRGQNHPLDLKAESMHIQRRQRSRGGPMRAQN